MSFKSRSLLYLHANLNEGALKKPQFDCISIADSLIKVEWGQIDCYDHILNALCRNTILQPFLQGRSHLIRALRPVAALLRPERLPNTTTVGCRTWNKNKLISLFSLVCLVVPIVNLSLSPPGTSNQIKSERRGRELQLWGPVCPF